MGLPRTFVSFSGTDIRSYWLMLAWKENERIDFNFADVQIEREIDSNDESYIKRVCRDHLEQAGTFIQLIGADTRYKYKYVRWEAEVAIEKGCRLIGVNLNGRREADGELTPAILKGRGAIFVPFHPRVIQHALENFKKRADQDWSYKPEVYKALGL